ncbi:NACHT domain-containing protein [Streptomyces ziwulingensis]|uniref:NACHT domain-containing protein n=1 Tax=Streptomyces ziwulingensis TaxID=1045501 RepID=A0ABP9C228_9ACTN
MWGRGDLRRPAATIGLLITVGVSGGLLVFLMTQGLEKSIQWLSVAAGVLGVATAAQWPVRRMVVWLQPGEPRPPPDLADTAELLARRLDRQWRREDQWREGGDALALPVRWEVTREAEFAMTGVRWGDLGSADSAVEPRLLAGQYQTIHETFTQRLPARRLVVLGRAGGGKSSLARRLARELLDHRSPGDRVPVFLSLASWGPEEALGAWVSQQLVRDHAMLGKQTPDRIEGSPVPLARSLVEDDRLLFVLDGFDEIPQASRAEALRGIKEIGARVPVVVTSRTDEYRQAVEDFGRGLPRAAAVELSPVDAPAVKSYLREYTALIPPDRWDEVFTLLDRADGNAVARALRVPLMIWLARLVYERRDRDPAELADPVAFADPTAVEHHLLDRMVTAAYRRPGRRSGPETVHRARRWLSFLARWLEADGTKDLEWWRLHGADPSAAARLTTGLPVGLAAGVPAGFITGTFYGPWAGIAAGAALTALATARAFACAWQPFGGRLPGPLLGRSIALATGFGTGLPLVLQGHLPVGVAQGTCVGMLAGLAAGFVVHEGPGAPTRVTVAIRGNRLAILRRLVTGLLVGVVFGAVLGLALGLVDGPTTGMVFAVLSVAMGFALGIVDGLRVWIDKPTDLRGSVSPRTVLRDDRTAALVRALVAGPLVAAATALTTAFAYGPRTGLALGGAMAFAYATTDRMVGVASTSWGRFTLVRAWLALRRQLPWHLMGFLDDAYDRGILRRSGAVHQFRHARLQQRLAAGPSGSAA